MAKKRIYGTVVIKSIPENITTRMKKVSPNDASTNSLNVACVELMEIMNLKITMKKNYPIVIRTN